MQFQVPSSEQDPASVLELGLEVQMELSEPPVVGLHTEATEVRPVGLVWAELADSVE